MGFKVDPKYLLVPPALEQTARAILAGPVTATEVQILRPDRTALKASPYFTDPDAWFVVKPKFSTGWADWRGVFGTSEVDLVREAQKERNQLYNQLIDAKMMQIAPWPEAKNLHIPKVSEAVKGVLSGKQRYTDDYDEDY